MPYVEGEEFLEEMSLDRVAGVLLVQEGGSSSCTGPAALEDVEESALEKKFVAPSGSTAATISLNSGGPGRAHNQWACSVQGSVPRVLHWT